MTLRRLLTGAVLSLGLALLASPAASAAGDPAPTAWQPVISNSSGAIGTFDTVTQPTNVTGVVVLLSPTRIPAPGSGTLTWNAGADTLSWRGGPPIPVSTATSATYVLPEPASGASVIVTVTPGALPSADAGDTLTVTRSRATAGLGDLARDTARAATVFNGDLYVGLGVRDANEAEVWRSADGVSWVLAALPNWGQAPATIHHVDSFIVFSGQLYAGTDEGQIWRTSDGSLWTQARPIQSYNANITSFAMFGAGGTLYANHANDGPGGVIGSPDGTSWASVFTFPEWQQMYPHDLQVFNGALFSSVGSYNGTLGQGPGALWSTTDGSNWSQSGTDGFGDPDNTDISGLAVFNGDLYAGTFNATQGAQVWRSSDGTSWQLVATNGFGDPHNTIIHELIVFDNELYVGTENDVEGGEIWRTADGTTWSLASVPGFGTGKYERIRSFAAFGGYLYANAGNDCTTDPGPNCQEGGWELWRLEAPPPTCTVTAVRRVGSAGFSGATDQEDVTVRAPGGLSSITNVHISDGTVSWGFAPGTTAPVVVTATKSAEQMLTRWSFDATDEAGQTTYCG